MESYRTEYNGIWFRSRAEAKWAAFFDLMGWRWEYEPRDYHGYIPDFVLLSNGEAGSRMYVEVKPEEEFPEANRKAKRSGVDSPVLFASTDGPFGFDASTSKYFLGPVLYRDKQSQASVTICQERDSHFCNPAMRKSHHGCGKFERSKHIRENYDKLGRYWSEAHNRTMWPARARRPTRVQPFNHCWNLNLSHVARETSALTAGPRMDSTSSLPQPPIPTPKTQRYKTGRLGPRPTRPRYTPHMEEGYRHRVDDRDTNGTSKSGSGALFKVVIIILIVLILIRLCSDLANQ